MAALGNGAVVKLGDVAFARVISIGGLARSIAEVPVPTLATTGMIPKLYSPQVQHESFEVTAYLQTNDNESPQPADANDWFATLGNLANIQVVSADGTDSWSAKGTIVAHNPGDFQADEATIATFTLSLNGYGTDGTTALGNAPPVVST